VIGIQEIPIYISFIAFSAGTITGVRRTIRVRGGRRIGYGLLTVLALVALIVSAGFLWYYNRPRPDDTQRLLFQGVEYIRDVREDPREIIIHVVKIDLDAPGIEFLVTPPDAPGEEVLQAQRTSDFLEEYDLQLAINGDFYQPFRSQNVLDYYPHINDPVSPRGLAASLGDVYTEGYFSQRAFDTLYLSADNDASFQRPAQMYNAISGWLMIVQNGGYAQPNVRGFFNTIYGAHPRTAIGLDAAEETLILVLVDGRQPNYSEGVSLPELAQIMIEYGVHTGLNLDGGGSTVLVIDDGTGDADVLSTPIDGRIPGRERVVANHLGVYAQALE